MDGRWLRRKAGDAGEREVTRHSIEVPQFRIATLDQQMIAAIDARETADKASLEKIQFVVKSVAGDPAYGEDSALYETMGYAQE